MGAEPALVVVVPCYNEAARLDSARLLAALDELAWLSFVLVDDGSTDRTLALLHELAAQRPGRIRVLALPENRGKAEAVRQGVLEATRDGAWGFGYWDADLATPLEELPRLKAALEEPEVRAVLGSRVRLLGRAIERRAERHYIGRAYATVVSLILRLEVYDTQCGSKLFRNDAVTRGLFEQPFQTRWSFDVELLLRLSQAARAGKIGPLGRTCREVPLERWQDVPGSKLGLSAAPRIARELGSLVWLALSGRTLGD
jgi:glycosyltransferase involved in cell wall biosynthesis